MDDDPNPFAPPQSSVEPARTDRDGCGVYVLGFAIMFGVLVFVSVLPFVLIIAIFSISKS